MIQGKEERNEDGNVNVKRQMRKMDASWEMQLMLMQKEWDEKTKEKNNKVNENELAMKKLLKIEETS